MGKTCVCAGIGFRMIKEAIRAPCATETSITEKMGTTANI